MVVVNPLVRSVAIVAAFWWLVLTVFAFISHPAVMFSFEGLRLSLGHAATALKFWIGFFILGAGGTIGVRLVRFWKTKAVLKAGRTRGMMSTIGDVPLPRNSIPAVTVLPDWLTDTQKLEHGRLIVEWMRAARKTHPAHAALTSKILRIFCQFPTLPASHIEGGHGGKTLLDHSLRVAAMAIDIAPTFVYEGLKSRFSTSIPWRDPGYQFNKDDPLIVIIALAHDIGKLQTFMLDSNGKVTGSRPGHDLAGARLLALLDELYELPHQDRSAILRSISHYHHPSDYPLTIQGQIDDDRTVALMMLMIKADKAAGKHEGNYYMAPHEYAAYLRLMQESGEELDAEQLEIMQRAQATSATGQGGASVRAPKEASITDEMMRKMLEKLLVIPGVIARSKEDYNKALFVGQLCTSDYPEWAWEIKASGSALSDEQQHQLSTALYRRIVVKEQDLRTRLAQAFGIQTQEKKGDGRYLLTIQALRVLHSMGVLDTSWNGGSISPESALFTVGFFNRNTRKPYADWKSILLKPEGVLAGMAEGAQHESLFRIKSPIWKDRKPKAQDAASTAADAGGAASASQDAERVDYGADNIVNFDDEKAGELNQQNDMDDDEDLQAPPTSPLSATSSMLSAMLDGITDDGHFRPNLTTLAPEAPPKPPELQEPPELPAADAAQHAQEPGTASQSGAEHLQGEPGIDTDNRTGAGTGAEIETAAMPEAPDTFRLVSPTREDVLAQQEAQKAAQDAQEVHEDAVTKGGDEVGVAVAVEVAVNAPGGIAADEQLALSGLDLGGPGDFGSGLPMQTDEAIPDGGPAHLDGRLPDAMESAQPASAPAPAPAIDARALMQAARTRKAAPSRINAATPDEHMQALFSMSEGVKAPAPKPDSAPARKDRELYSGPGTQDATDSANTAPQRQASRPPKRPSAGSAYSGITIPAPSRPAPPTSRYHQANRGGTGQDDGKK